MTYTLSLTDYDGVVLKQWMVGPPEGYPLPLRALGADEIISEINDEIHKWEGSLDEN